MENFDPRPQEVKEKSFYILHLDTPRIIILTSVVIGIIAAAFLLGMSFMKGDKSHSKEFAMSDMEFDESRGSDLLNKDIPQVPGEGTVDSVPGDKTVTDELKTEPSAGTDLNKNSFASNQLQGKADILKSEDIKEVIPPANDKKSSDKKIKTAVKKPQHKSSKTVASDNNRKKDDRHSKSRIYEVSRDENSAKNYDSWAIQVASYDTVSRAEKEKSLLRAKDYDAYIDKAVVNGKNYFRVRIGPLTSRKKAGDLLGELQSDSRYSGSYMLKE